jgi:S1-C subfamily serine protease
MSIEIFSQMTVVIAQLRPGGGVMLGTGFLAANGCIATTHHVIGNERENLVILSPPRLNSLAFQDLTLDQSDYAAAQVGEIDPFRDIAILRAALTWNGHPPPLGALDQVHVGTPVDIFGYPHCVLGRRAFTYQRAEIGAKVLLENNRIKSKHGVINVQARPGQSGSPVVEPATQRIIGMLIGAWVPGAPNVLLGAINPEELHQTTHCVSADHIKDML